MDKNKLFIDFDATLVSSVEAFISTYNELYQNHPNFTPADPNKVTEYNFSCQCKLLNNNHLDIFKHDLFFRNLELINDNTYEILLKLKNKYNLIIVTIGCPSNLAKKSLWIEDNLPFIKDYVLLSNDGCKMNKSLVDMSGIKNVFIDDIPSNLRSTNAETKILFGKIFPWNKDWKGEYCLTWSDVEERLLG